MNTKVVVGLVLIIIIAAGAYLVFGKNLSMQPGTGPTTLQNPNESSMSALVAAGKPVTCTFSTSTPSGSTQGTMYIANGMMAGDFTSSGTQAGSITSHMIVRDQTSYMWTSLSNQGFKSTLNANATGGATQNQGVDYNAQASYNCQPWSADSTKFNLPTNISFAAAPTYVPPSQGAGATGAASAGASQKGTAEQCAQCNGLPTAQKAQCLAALQC